MNNPYFPIKPTTKWQRFRSWFSKKCEKLKPGPQAKKDAAIGIIIFSFIVIVSSSITSPLGIQPYLDAPIGIFISLALVFIAGLATILLLKLIKFLLNLLTWPGFLAAGGTITIVSMMIPPPFGPVMGLIFIIVEALLAFAIGFLCRWGFADSPLSKKIWVFTVLVVAVFINIYSIYWLWDKGYDDYLVKYKETTGTVDPLNAPDPSNKGTYNVLDMFYGSGTDRNRPEFADNVAIKTKTVDATPFVKNNTGWEITVRDWLLGFDFTAFPVNGHVWYPEGEGPFPLILIVHGNHNMAEFSDPGYAYLGNLLASRGFITVSVDENFFNGAFIGGLSNENDGRGWMLLQHLTVWREWNDNPGNLFHGKVDMNHIGLIGHSRGGEAAAIAGAFNRLSHYPDDATETFDFNFNIRGIVSIAPSDGQYKPADRSTPLENVNYLVLQGAHDSDVSSFAGVRQYNRVKFTDDQYWFKACLYSYRSNHGQFNTVWGDADWGWPLSIFINRKPLLSGDDQRKISKIYISAFMEAALHENTAYVQIFRDHRSIAEWLPKDYFITRFKDSTFQNIADFEEDIDVTSASLKGASIQGENLAVWREEDPGFRSGGEKQNNVVVLGWQEKESGDDDNGLPSYSIKLPENCASLNSVDDSSFLVFSLADTGEKPPAKDDEKEGEEKNEEKKETENQDTENEEDKTDEEEPKPIQISIELGMDNDTTIRLPLADFAAIPPLLKSKFTKIEQANSMFGKQWEITLQTFELPLKAFTQKNDLFTPNRIRTIRFVFDNTNEGVIVLDQIGFAQK